MRGCIVGVVADGLCGHSIAASKLSGGGLLGSLRMTGLA
jgi:hypothetical protein